MQENKLILVDGHSLLFRAFYAFPPLNSPDGRLVNAAYGFTSILLSVIAEHSPTHIAVCFDMHGETKRKQGFADYKAQRQPTPPDLLPQIEITHQVVEALNIPIFELTDYEADDLIGTLATQAVTNHKTQSLIVTGDHDLLQLVADNKIHVYFPKRGKKPAVILDEMGVVEEMGIRVDQVVDYKALAGDSSDNIPGIKGIGPKTAINLLTKYDSLEELYRQLDSLLSDKLVEELSPKELKAKASQFGFGVSVVTKLASDKQMAYKSQELATILTDAPIALDLDACRVHGYDKPTTLALFGELGFNSLIRRLPADEFEVGVQEALF